MAISKKKTGTVSAPKTGAPARKVAVKTSASVAAPVSVKTAVPAPASEAKVARRPSISLEERHRMIAEAAYFIALKKGFLNSDPQENWTEAETQIDSMLKG